MSATGEKAADGRLDVEIWTDLICPWCKIGERRFEQALRDFEHRDHVRIFPRAYRLMPDHPAQPINTVLIEKYEMLPEEIPGGLKKLEDVALTEGLVYRLADSYAGDTIDGHRLIKKARQQGTGDAVYERLYMACMAEQARFFDHGVLRKLCLEAGMDSDAIDEVLAGSAFREDVLADESRMRTFGGRAAPFFVLNGELTYAGALEPSVFLGALRKAWDQGGKAEQGDTTVSGDGCGPDGCLI